MIRRTSRRLQVLPKRRVVERKFARLAACDAIERKIAHNNREIKRIERKRYHLRTAVERQIRNLQQDPRGLPAALPGDHINRRASRRGRQLELSDYKTDLAKAEAELARKEAYAAKLAADLAACKKAEKEAKEKAAKECVEKAEKEGAEKLMEKTGKEGTEKLGESLVKKGLQKGVGAVARKIPLVAAGFFVLDWSNGGFGHAVNEATWPVSELWD